MKHTYLKADIFPIRIELHEEDLASGFVFYANSKLLAKNILIQHTYIGPTNEDHGLPVHDIEIKFISKKGFLYNYSIYSSYEDSIAPIQISRIIIDAVQELTQCQTDEEIHEFIEYNLFSGAVYYTDEMNKNYIEKITEIWKPFFKKIQEAYIDRKDKVKCLFDELPV